MARGEESGEFRVAIEEEAFFCFDDSGDGIPREEYRTVCAFEFDAVGFENMRRRPGGWEDTCEFPGVVERMRQQQDGNGSFDVGGADESGGGDPDGSVGRGTGFERDKSEEGAEDEADGEQVDIEFTPTGVEGSVAEVEDVHIRSDGMRFVVRDVLWFGQHEIAARR